MTSIPASRSARAMIFAPRSWPSRPGLATTTRILRAMGPSISGGGSRRAAAPSARYEEVLLCGADVRADRADELVRDLGESVIVARVVGDLGEDLAVAVAA